MTGTSLHDTQCGTPDVGNMAFLRPGEWPTSIGCGRAATAALHGRRIVALRSSALAQHNGLQVGEIMRTHHCSLEQPGDDCQVVATPGYEGRKQAVAAQEGPQ